MILLLGVAGIYSYLNLGRAEDPSFTIKTMVVHVAWPGATASEMQDPGHRQNREEAAGTALSRPHRKLFAARRVVHPGLSDRPDAARQGEGALVPGPQEGRRYQGRPAARRHRTELQRRVRRRLFGDLHADRRRHEPRRAQDARRRHSPAAAARRRRQQGRHHRRAAAKNLHRVQPRQAGDARHHPAADFRQRCQAERRHLRRLGRHVGRPHQSAGHRGVLRCRRPSPRCRCRSDGHVFRLGDIATVKRGYQDPPSFIVREGGKPALGLGVSMQDGANIITLGENLKTRDGWRSSPNCRSGSKSRRSPTSRTSSSTRSRSSSRPLSKRSASCWS